jgi:hypothetical protein
MRSIKTVVTFVLAGVFSFAGAVSADTPATSKPEATAPTSAPVEAPIPMRIYITAVSGLVQVREADDQPWKPALVKMLISQGAELRTGPHSSVTCVIPPDQTFTLDRLGTVRVEEAAKHGNKITTDLIMKYGRTHYDIESAGLEHEATIVSPSSTLAVRGTNVSLFDQPPFAPVAISYTGRAAFTYARSTVAVGKKGGAFAMAKAGTTGAAQTALAETLVTAQYSDALTTSETALLNTEVARGAVLGYNTVSGIPTVSDGRPSYDSELPSVLPGSLNFVLRWTGNANLNIEVGVDKGDPLTNILNGFQQGEFLYPGYGYQNSASGGHIPFDNLGGPRGGEEFAYWSGVYPEGLYGLAAQSMSGAATSFTLNVFANGTPLNMYYFASDGVTLIKSTQVTRTLDPGQFFSVLTLVPPSSLVESITPDDPAGNPNPGINPGNFPLQPAVASAAMASPRDIPSVSVSSAVVTRPGVIDRAPTPYYIPAKMNVSVMRR